MSTSSSYNFTLNSNRDLVAHFSTVNYTLTITASPSNGGTTTVGGTYPAGSSITVIATGNPGYRFVNWTENLTVVSTSSTYTFTLNSNRDLVAHFTPGPVATLLSPIAGASLTFPQTFSWSLSDSSNVRIYFAATANAQPGVDFIVVSPEVISGGGSWCSLLSYGPLFHLFLEILPNSIGVSEMLIWIKRKFMRIGGRLAFAPSEPRVTSMEMARPTFCGKIPAATVRSY